MRPRRRADRPRPGEEKARRRASYALGARYNWGVVTRHGHQRGSTRQWPIRFEQAISSDDGDQAAKIIQDALGIESDDVANYCFPKNWPADREQRARIIGDWLQAEARFLA